MKLIIDITEETISEIKDNAMFASNISSDIRWNVTGAIVNGIPVEEFDNPCIYCGDNCCGAEYEDKRCECQKVFMIKENKE